MKYRKKPVIIEAFKYGYDTRPEWFNDAVTAHTVETFIGMDRKEIQDYYCIIETLEGGMKGKAGDYIIQGVQGEIYPCREDIFEATYEQV